jgi:hypothetical protein
MAAITVQTILETGITVSTTSAAGGGDTFANDGNTYYQVTNGSGSSINVTFTVVNGTFTNKQNGILTKSNLVVAVANGTTKLIGPFPTGVYNSTSGTVAVAYSSATSVTVAAINL